MGYKEDTVILNGQSKIVTDLTEFKMSLWVNGFGIINHLTGEEIIPLITIFNLDKYEEYNETVKLVFRIYPDGLRDYEVEINPVLRTFIYKNETYPTSIFFKTITGKEWK